MSDLGIKIASLVVVANLAHGAVYAQTQNQPLTPIPTTGTTSTVPAPAATPAKKRAKPSAAHSVERIPIENAPSSTPAPASASQQVQQRAADQQLLQQQQQQSDKAAQINNAIVDKAQKQQDQMQKEVRIQDAPGPAQTGSGMTPQVGMPAVPNGGVIDGVPASSLPASQSISPSDLPPVTPPQTPVVPPPH